MLHQYYRLLILNKMVLLSLLYHVHKLFETKWVASVQSARHFLLPFWAEMLRGGCCAGDSKEAGL